MIIEKWRPVVGYEGRYEVSDMGRVRSFVYGRKGKVLRLGVRKNDRYLVASMSRPNKGGMRTHFVHSVVLTAFVGPRPDGMQAAHWNGVRDDNRVSNLRWATTGENRADCIRHGTVPVGEKNPRAKISHDAAYAIKATTESVSIKNASRIFGIGRNQVSAIRTGVRWSHVEVQAK